jgi:hypothetical protein
MVWVVVTQHFHSTESLSRSVDNVMLKGLQQHISLLKYPFLSQSLLVLILHLIRTDRSVDWTHTPRVVVLSFNSIPLNKRRKTCLSYLLTDTNRQEESWNPDSQKNELTFPFSLFHFATRLIVSQVDFSATHFIFFKDKRLLRSTIIKFL